MVRSTFELQGSVIYQCQCTLKNKSNGVIKITYGHHPWNREDPLDPPLFEKDFKIRSAFVVTTCLLKNSTYMYMIRNTLTFPIYESPIILGVMDQKGFIILGIKKILHGSRRVHEG